ncbi:restriction endonuclease subunit S [Helicobacter pylori]
MIGPLSSQLNAIKWGEFKLGDLFEIYTGSLLSQEDLAKGDIVRISVKSDNNGVYGHFDTLKNKKARHFENFISVNFFGNCFYHPYLASVEMKVHVLKLKNRTLTKRIGLFLANQLNKCFYGQFTYGTQLSSSKLKHNNFKIQLPLKPTANAQTLEDIDFPFMEKFIAELEQCRLAELEAYLKATGLENTTLSSDEENALKLFNNSIGGNTPCGLRWQSFKLGDLFEASNGDFDIQKRHLGQSDIKAKVFESHTITIDMFGCAFYRSFPYKMVTHARVFSLKPKFEINHKIGLFLSTLFFDYPKKFGYENMCSWAKIKNDKVILPLKPTANAQTLEDIDFPFMHTLINALMKQTIQGVAEYCNAKIQAAKEIINQETPTPKDSLF